LIQNIKNPEQHLQNQGSSIKTQNGIKNGGFPTFTVITFESVPSKKCVRFGSNRNHRPKNNVVVDVGRQCNGLQISTSDQESTPETISKFWKMSNVFEKKKFLWGTKGFL
jgi:hypothetical protein